MSVAATYEIPAVSDADRTHTDGINGSFSRKWYDVQVNEDGTTTLLRNFDGEF